MIAVVMMLKRKVTIFTGFFRLSCFTFGNVGRFESWTVYEGWKVKRLKGWKVEV